MTSGAPGPLYLGIDLGTSGMKAVAADASGRAVAEASCAYPTSRPSPGAAEQRPADWVAATESVVRTLSESVDGGAVRALSLSGMLPTLVCLDRAFEPVGPAITWEDGRAEAFGSAFEAEAGTDLLYSRTGQHVDGRYLLPMYARLAEEGLEHSSVDGICGAKDYLFSWLTGEVLTDPSTAAGYGCFDLAEDGFDAGLVESAEKAFSLPVPRLPAVMPAGTVRPLTARPADRLGLAAGTPVCLGAADSVLGALGLGATAPGDVAYIWGTSTVVLAVADRPLYDPQHRYLVTPLWRAGLYGLEMDLLSTGAALAWLAALTGLSPAELVAMAGEVPPAEAPVFLPYLGGGEQGALWDPTLRGAAVGLELVHGRAAISRGLLNGILRETRRCLDTLPPLGSIGGSLRAAGGPLGDASFRRDLAAATGRAVVTGRSRDADHSAIGAALLAASALGETAAEAAGDEPRFERTEPGPELAGVFDSVFARYDEVFGQLNR